MSKRLRKRFAITNPFMIIVAICALLLALLILIAVLKLIKTTKQKFNENSKISQEMFDSNIIKTDSLSKKIFEQIEVLQGITNNQIEITDKQLITIKKLLKEQKEITDKQLTINNNLLNQRILKEKPLIKADFLPEITD